MGTRESIDTSINIMGRGKDDGKYGGRWEAKMMEEGSVVGYLPRPRADSRIICFYNLLLFKKVHKPSAGVVNFVLCRVISITPFFLVDHQHHHQHQQHHHALRG